MHGPKPVVLSRVIGRNGLEDLRTTEKQNNVWFSHLCREFAYTLYPHRNSFSIFVYEPVLSANRIIFVDGA